MTSRIDGYVDRVAVFVTTRRWLLLMTIVTVPFAFTAVNRYFNGRDFFSDYGDYAEIIFEMWVTAIIAFYLLKVVTERNAIIGSLRETEHRYRTFLDSTTDMAYLKDETFHYVMVNRANQEFFGKAEVEIVGKTDFELMPPSAAENCRCSDLEALTHEGIIVTEEQIGGRVFEAKKFAVGLENGKVGVGGLIREVTERKRAEEVLQTTLQRFYTILSSMYAGVLLVTDEGRVEFANQAFCDLFGLDDLPSDLHGMAGPEMIQKIQDLYAHPAEAVARIQAIVAQQRPVKEEEVAIRGARTYMRDFIPILIDGKPYGRLWYHRDITERKEAVYALSESEEKFRNLFNNSEVGMFRTRLDGSEILDMNDKFLKIFGWTREEMRGKPSVIHWADPQEREEMVRRLNIDGRVTDFECKMLNKQGDVRMCVTSLRLYPDQGVLEGSITDITDKKVAQSQASEAHELREEMVTESPMGIAVYREDGQCISANEALGRIVGADPERLVTQNFRNLSSWKDSGLLAEADQVLSGGINTQREVHVTSTFGKSFWVNARMARITSGGKPHLLIVFNDITGRRTVEDALRFEREQLLSIFESVNEVVMVIDTQTYEILYANKYTEDLYGKKLIGGFCYERLTGFDTPCGHCFNDKILELQGQPYQWEYSNPILKRDFLATDRMIRWPDGREVKFQIAIDITERNNAQQEQAHLRAQLFQAQKMESVGTLAGGIAHDFNNLLQVTLGYSELLLQEKTEHDADYGDLQKIFHAARSGAELVRSLLAFSRKAEPKPVPMNLNGEIRHVEKLLHRTIPRMIDIRLDLAEELERINADPAQIEQIIMNLAVNARDAMGEEGSLKIRTESVTLDDEYCRFNVEAKPGDYVLLSVSDTGHGMDRETLQRIFEPFYTTKELGRGTGLGLAMVYGIVRQHGGHIDCYSEVGKGTTFKLYFPVIPSIGEPAVEATGIMPAFGTETVLLVDDEDLVRELGQRILTRSGYTVLTAARGEEALEVYGREKERIALVILDLIMPTMGGKDCLKKILKIDPQARILISSGYSADASTKECLGMGAKGFVAKPFRFKEFLQQVRMALDET